LPKYWEKSTTAILIDTKSTIVMRIKVIII
jgi:hypothetical protein